MNIKEVEKVTGLKRGSIRFYEEENLIKPCRNENGYRSYTEQDVVLLKKIKLLRILGIPIQAVKKIVIHDESLVYVLEQNVYKLEEEKEHLALSVNICEKMLEDGIEFYTFDEDVYFQMLERNLNQGRMNVMIEDDCSKREECAWQRYFARYIDFGVYDIVLWQVLYQGFSLDYLEWLDSWFSTGPYSLLKSFILALISVLVMMVIEPILLTSIGTTFGKCIMRVRIVHHDGRYLTYIESLKRTWLVLQYGMGFVIPFYELYRNYKSYSRLEEDGVLQWEAKTNSFTEVFPMNRVYCILFIVILLGIMIIKSVG